MRKVFPCPVCSREFSRPDKMKNHMKSVHEGGGGGGGRLGGGTSASAATSADHKHELLINTKVESASGESCDA
jgi:hypothetical protein